MSDTMSGTKDEMNNDDWLTVSEAARILGVSRTWILKLVEAGKLEHRWTKYGRIISRKSVHGRVGHFGRPPEKAKDI